MSEPRPRPSPKRPPLSRARIAEICGDITDAQASALVRIGATEEELEAAALWAAGDTELLARGDGHPLTGRAAAAYDILTTANEFDDEPD